MALLRTYQEVVSISWASPDAHVWTAGEVLTAANMNTYIRLNLDFLYGDTAWQVPTLINSWVNAGAPNPNAGYRLLGTRVVVRGTVKTGTVGAPIFVLPVGYRPPGTIYFATLSANALATSSVDSAGNVSSNGGSNASFSLDSVNFDTLP
jgi:hypothetical protein